MSVAQWLFPLLFFEHSTSPIRINNTKHSFIEMTIYFLILRIGMKVIEYQIKPRRLKMIQF